MQPHDQEPEPGTLPINTDEQPTTDAIGPQQHITDPGNDQHDPRKPTGAPYGDDEQDDR